jgi:hypothetical protein
MGAVANKNGSYVLFGNCWHEINFLPWSMRLCGFRSRRETPSCNILRKFPINANQGSRLAVRILFCPGLASYWRKPMVPWIEITVSLLKKDNASDSSISNERRWIRGHVPVVSLIAMSSRVPPCDSWISNSPSPCSKIDNEFGPKLTLTRVPRKLVLYQVNP